MEGQINYEVIIIGAGAAGVSAAREFEQKKISYIILEAQDRVGGRTKIENGIDYGAAWIHFSKENDNPIPALVKSLGLVCKPSESTLCRIFDVVTGNLVENEQLRKGLKLAHDFFTTFEQKRAQLTQDVTIRELMKTELVQLEQLPDQFLRRIVDNFFQVLENYDASSFNQISSLQGVNWEDLIMDEDGQDQSDDVVLLEGYATLINKLAEGQSVELNKVVTEVDYDNFEKIIVKCKDGSQYISHFCLVTVPLGVLKANTIKFQPKLPLHAEDFIEKMGFGLMNKVIFEFEECFWKNTPLDQFSLLSERKGKYPFFYNLEPFTKRNLLVCLITGTFAEEKQNQDKDSIIKECLEFLQKGLESYGKLPKLIYSDVTEWGKNEYARGSYTFYSVDSNETLQADMEKPILNKVLFAGEALARGEYIGTLHGAYSSGQHQAQKIVELIKN